MQASITTHQLSETNSKISLSLIKKNNVSNQSDLLVPILICDGASVVGNLFSKKQKAVHELKTQQSF